MRLRRYRPVHLLLAENALMILDKIHSCLISRTTPPPHMIEAITETIHAGIRPREYLQTLNTIMVRGSLSQKGAIKKFRALLPSHTCLRSNHGNVFLTLENGLAYVKVGS